MLKAVIIGCGNIAGGYDTKSKKQDYWSHVKSYNANKDVKVVGVYEINAAVRNAFIDYWGIEKGYDCITDMLKTQPEIVSICSPNRFHFEQIIACADAG